VTLGNRSGSRAVRARLGLLFSRSEARFLAQRSLILAGFRLIRVPGLLFGSWGLNSGADAALGFRGKTGWFCRRRWYRNGLFSML